MASEEHTVKAMETWLAHEEAVRECIRDELRELIPECESSLADAAARKHEAWEEMQLPLKVLNEAKAELADAEKALAEWHAKRDSRISDERVQARMMIASWSPEVDLLHSRVDQLQTAYGVFKAKYDEASADYGVKENRVMMLTAAIEINPFFAEGQDTPSYRLWREFCWKSKMVLIDNDRKHPEWGAFVRGMDDVSHRAGYSTRGMEERVQRDAQQNTRRFFPAIPNLSDSLPMQLAT